MSGNSPQRTSNAVDSGLPAVVELNVGGQLYTTSLTTLLRDPESRIAAMFSGRQRILRDSSGRYFIDRDGQSFRYILDYLRNSRPILPEDVNEKERLLGEAEYFQLKGLIKVIKQQLMSREGDAKPGDAKPVAGGYLTLNVMGSAVHHYMAAVYQRNILIEEISVGGNIGLSREVFGNLIRDEYIPPRPSGENITHHSSEYTNNFHKTFLNSFYELEKAFDMLNQHGFRLVTSCAGGSTFGGGGNTGNYMKIFEIYTFHRT